CPKACRLRLCLDGHDVDRGLRVSTAALDDQLRSEERRRHSVIRVDAALEAIRRVRLEAQTAGRSADHRRLEPGAFEQNVPGAVRDLAVEPADDAAEGNGAAGVGDDDGL